MIIEKKNNGTEALCEDCAGSDVPAVCREKGKAEKGRSVSPCRISRRASTSRHTVGRGYEGMKKTS